MVSWNLILIAAYFVIVLGIGYWSSRKQSAEDYLIASRSLPWWKIAMSNASGLVGAGLMVALATFSFMFGVSVIWATFGAFMGFVLLAIFARRLKNMSDAKRFYTFSDYFYTKWGKIVGLAVTAMVFIAYFMIMAGQFIGSATMLEHISGLTYPLAVIVSAVAIIIYLSLGGFRAVIKTDIFQYAAMMLLLCVMLFSIKTQTFVALGKTMFSAGFTQNLSFAVIGFFAVVVAADVWQRIYAARSVRDCRIGMVASGVMFFFLATPFVILGALARVSFPNILPKDALVHGLFELTPILFGIGAVVVFAAIMSSIDTQLFVASMNISKDIASRYRTLTKEKLVLITRIAIVVLAICAAAVAILFSGIEYIFMAVMGISLVFAPIVIGSFLMKLKRNAVLATLVIGFIYTIAITISGQLSAELTALAFPVAVLTLIIGQKLFRR